MNNLELNCKFSFASLHQRYEKFLLVGQLVVEWRNGNFSSAFATAEIRRRVD